MYQGELFLEKGDICTMDIFLQFTETATEVGTTDYYILQNGNSTET